MAPSHLLAWFLIFSVTLCHDIKHRMRVVSASEWGLKWANMKIMSISLGLLMSLQVVLQEDLDYSRQLTRSSQSEEVKEPQDAGTSKNTRDTKLNENANHEGFWGKLMLAAEQKVGAAEAERFCKAFQQVYEKLVYEELSLDAARKFINS